MTFTVGLTGGIGSGKSTVMSLFSELGIDTTDADLLVRNLLDTDKNLLQEIRIHFGPEYFNHDGQLDRQALRARIFSNKNDRHYLESLIHPRIRELLQLARNKFQSPYGIVVVPLLIEANMTDLVDRVVVVDIPEEEQIERIMQRDGISKAMASQAMASQIPRKQRLDFADDVIDNTTSLDNLRSSVRQLHEQYLELARQH
jgi:dephospho-CoA kinase